MKKLFFLLLLSLSIGVNSRLLGGSSRFSSNRDARSDPCQSKPCGRHGSCTTSSTSPYYKCRCYLPYYGETCAKQYCRHTTPCLNGGSCSSSTYSPGYRCNCINGYSGINCEKDACYGSPCENGGTCTHSNMKQYYGDGYHGDDNGYYRYSYVHYKCACAYPYFGYRCQKEYCTDSRPCKNGGVCRQSTFQPGYECECRNGYSGLNCTNAKIISHLWNWLLIVIIFGGLLVVAAIVGGCVLIKRHVQAYRNAFEMLAQPGTRNEKE